MGAVTATEDASDAGLARTGCREPVHPGAAEGPKNMNAMMQSPGIDLHI